MKNEYVNFFTESRGITANQKAAAGQN